MRHAMWMALAVGLAALQTGCAYLPGRESFSRLGLPSPKATVAAAEKDQPASEKKLFNRSAAKPKKPVGEREVTAGMDIARARTYEQSGHYDKARKIYEDLRQREPENVEAAHRLGIVADIQKRHGEAEGLFRFALERQPDDAELTCDLGYCLFLQGKLASSAEVLQRAVKLAPTSPRAHNNFGLALGHLEKHEEALEQFALAGSEADAYYNLAFVYAAQDRADDAKECFRRCMLLDPSHQRANNALASFGEYERLSPEMRDQMTEVASGGVRYVPYQEVINAGAEINSGVQQASAQANIPATRDAGRST